MRMRLMTILALMALTAVVTAAQGQPDFSKVEVKITEIAPSLYTLDGQGGTMGALVGADGVFVVDAQFAPLTEKLVAAIRRVTEQPIKYLVNTHEHFDHTSANFYFNRKGVPIVATEGCLRAMKEDGEQDFKRMLAPVPTIYNRFPGLEMTCPKSSLPMQPS